MFHSFNSMNRWSSTVQRHAFASFFSSARFNVTSLTSCTFVHRSHRVSASQTNSTCMRSQSIPLPLPIATAPHFISYRYTWTNIIVHCDAICDCTFDASHSICINFQWFGIPKMFSMLHHVAFVSNCTAIHCKTTSNQTSPWFLLILTRIPIDVCSVRFVHWCNVHHRQYMPIHFSRARAYTRAHATHLLVWAELNANALPAATQITNSKRWKMPIHSLFMGKLKPLQRYSNV